MNIREKLEELGYTQDKINLEEAIFNESKNEIELIFSYAEWNVLTDQQKEEIINVCKQSFDDTAVLVRFKGAFVDDEILYQMLKRFLENNYKAMLNVFDVSKVKFVKNDKSITINLLCDKVTADMISTSTFKSELCSFMKDECFYDFVLEVSIEKAVKLDDALAKPKESGQSLSWALDQEKLLNKIEVNNIEYLFGKVIEQQPNFIVNLVMDDNQSVVAGIVSDFMESKYQKKQKDPEFEPVEATKFSFNLTDASGTIRVIVFPSEKDVEKLKLIEDGKTLIVSGGVSDYKGSLSLRARSISTCQFVSNEIHYCYRGVNDKYNVVTPKEWVEVSQMDLFSITSDNVSDYLRDNKIVMFDLETTGLDPETCMITEIGAVKIENGKCTEYFQTLVNPQTPIPQEVTEKTHITDEMVRSAPTIDQVLPDFYKFVDGCVLSAYNIGFDYSFLKKIGHKLRYKFDNVQIDCLDVVRQKVASLSNYKLATVSKALNVELKNAHRALADALAAAKVFIKLM